MNQKEFHHREQIKDAARDGIARHIEHLLRFRNADSRRPDAANSIADEASDLSQAVVTSILKHFTIRPRVRR